MWFEATRPGCIIWRRARVGDSSLRQVHAARPLEEHDLERFGQHVWLVLHKLKLVVHLGHSVVHFSGGARGFQKRCFLNAVGDFRAGSRVKFAVVPGPSLTFFHKC